MASEANTPAFEDLDPVDTSEDSGGSDWIDPEPGETVSGRITGYNPTAGFNGVIELDGRPMYLNGTLKNQLIAALVEGNTMAVRVAEDAETFEDSDGETTEYYPKEARFAGGD
ncbi:hypothetical protein [Halobaculum sp. EA56]|uniref:hypothetical protein n=1 Tax=Halobaculum sp. EA56 TaxID=3421648 RepID=UPI003EBBA8BD